MVASWKCGCCPDLYYYYGYYGTNRAADCGCCGGDTLVAMITNGTTPDRTALSGPCLTLCPGARSGSATTAGWYKIDGASFVGQSCTLNRCYFSCAQPPQLNGDSQVNSYYYGCTTGSYHLVGPVACDPVTVPAVFRWTAICTARFGPNTPTAQKTLSLALQIENDLSSCGAPFTAPQNCADWIADKIANACSAGSPPSTGQRSDTPDDGCGDRTFSDAGGGAGTGSGLYNITQIKVFA